MLKCEFIETAKPKLYFCPTCNDHFYQWTAYKHKSTRRHIFNELPDDEKNIIMRAKELKKTQGKIERLKEKMTALETAILTTSI
jgi:hypothetical protein